MAAARTQVFGYSEKVRALIAVSLLVAAAAGPQKLRLRVGESVDLHIISTQTICDDPSIVKVEAVGDVIRLTGLRAGQTLCSLGMAGGPRTLYEITVMAAPPKRITGGPGGA